MVLSTAGSAQHPQQAVALAPAAPWQHQRFWTGPAASQLLSQVVALPRQRMCLFEAQLLSPSLSFLWDHQVQGRPVLPGTALLELAQVTAHMLAGSAEQPGSAATSSLLLQGCSIPAPVTLGASAAAMQLQVQAGLGDGSLVVRGMQSRNTHLTGHASQHRQAHLQQAGSSNAAPMPLATLLLNTTAVGPMAFQTASLAVDPRKLTDGFCSHPAVVDSSLHLGASLARPSSGAAPVIRVPVGVQALATGGEWQPRQADLWAACRLHGVPAAQGPAVSSYTLRQAAAPAAAAAVDVSGLEARPIQLPAAAKAQLFSSSTAAKATQQAAAEAADVPLLYEVRWEASSQAAQHRGLAQPAPGGIRLAIKSGQARQARILSSSSSSNAVAPLVRLLAHLQQVTQSGTAGASIQLSTCGATQAYAGVTTAPVTTAAAAAWGMVRVAASEAPDASWAAVDRDGLAPGSQQGASEAADVAGSLVRHGLALRPMLLPSAGAGQESSSEPTACLSGRVLVTGGLGGGSAGMGLWEQRVCSRPPITHSDRCLPRFALQALAFCLPPGSPSSPACNRCCWGARVPWRLPSRSCCWPTPP